MLAPCATRSASVASVGTKCSPTPVDQRHAPDHLVAVGHPVDRADPVAAASRTGRLRRGAGESADERPRIVAGDGKAGLGRRGSATAGWRAPSPAPSAPRDRLREDRVVARHGRRSSGEIACGPLPTARFTASSGEVRSGSAEQDVEGDDRRALAASWSSEIGDGRARPRPLADPGERILVDIDDAHRQGRVVGCRRQPLVGIEGDQPERPDEERVGDAKRHGPGQERKNQKNVAPACPDGHRQAASLLRHVLNAPVFRLRTTSAHGVRHPFLTRGDGRAGRQCFALNTAAWNWSRRKPRRTLPLARSASMQYDGTGRTDSAERWDLCLCSAHSGKPPSVRDRRGGLPCARVPGGGGRPNPTSS